MATELQVTPPKGTTQLADTILIGFITIGGTGAITAQGSTSGNPCGVTWTRNATGDYRGTLHRGYKRAVTAYAHVVAPAAATAKSLTAGEEARIQGITAANFAGTSSISTVALTTTRQDTGALADPTSGVTLTYSIHVADL